MRTFSRRQILSSAAATALLGTIPSILIPRGATFAAQQTDATTLRVGTRTIEVNGRAARVYGLTQADGTQGLITEAGRRFRVRLENRLGQETLIHWHGLTPPWQQDGVPGLSQAPLAPGASYDYDFPLELPGTNWMHSHHGLTEQQLLAAPLIVRDPAEAADDVQEVVVLFHDFTFRDPLEILAELGAGGNTAHGAAHAGSASMDRVMEGGHAAGHGSAEPGRVHLHDVEYDAFLANDRNLDDPQVFRVERGARVRLRLINGATATAFWIDLDQLEGRLIAVDGAPVVPVSGQRFEFAMGQRLDILLDLPAQEGAWPVFAVREGERARTGFVLATRNATLRKLPGEARQAVTPVGLDLERRLRAARPLVPRAADRSHRVEITEAPGYKWMLNGALHGAHTPLRVREGERVEITFADRSSMAHPMHLHGHHFQVVAIDGQRIPGALRDTVLVPARGDLTIAFDAVNPGKWALHCHHLYHMAAGMMTTVEYDV